MGKVGSRRALKEVQKSTEEHNREQNRTMDGIHGIHAVEKNH